MVKKRNDDVMDEHDEQSSGEESEVDEDLGTDDSIEDYGDDYDDEGPVTTHSRRSSVDDLKAIDFEVALRANPKRANSQRKEARPLDGVSSLQELADPEKATKVWKKIEKIHANDDAKTYRVNENYELEDIINHPTFGRGYVVEILSNTKFAVLFKDGLRRLMYNVHTG